jgi:hypothetical protein
MQLKHLQDGNKKIKIKKIKKMHEGFTTNSEVGQDIRIRKKSYWIHNTG